MDDRGGDVEVTLTFGSLFAGIGGIDLGLERAGMTCRWQVENDPYCVRVLTKHWPAVPKYGDIKELDPHVLEPVDLIAGGFPCQPVSAVGERNAQDDPRWLWPDFYRVVRLVRPRDVVVENVTGLLHRGMGDVLRDLASIGFDAEWSVLSACAVGAPHPRERVFIVAHPPGERLEWSRLPAYPRPALLAGQGRGTSVGGYWATEPRPHGVAYGVSSRVDRLRGHGNAVVPQVAEYVGRRIMEAV
jgi:DNA (cytosine-5)-methyltransferase 1